MKATINSELPFCVQTHATLVVALFIFLLDVTSCGFRETPAFSTGELHEKIVLRCSYYKEFDRLAGASSNKIRIEWLKADPQITTSGGSSSSNQQSNFKPFLEDKKRIFIKIGSTSDTDWKNPYPDIVTNTRGVQCIYLSIF